MCILCESEALELLTTPLDRLGPGRLAEAIRTAREAAGVGVVDRAEAIVRDDAPTETDADLYGDIVIERALEDGVIDSSDAYAWRTRLDMGAGGEDPRVQAFLSSCAEVIDECRVVAAERRRIIERFLEAPGRVGFAGFGPDGEPWFEYGDESYAALTQDEAMEIVERELATLLDTLDAELLLRYTRLPAEAAETIERARTEPTDVANAILAELVDVGALADDLVQVEGYSPFVRGDPPRETTDARFGDWVILRFGRPA